MKSNRAVRTLFGVLAGLSFAADAARGAVFKEFPVPTPASDPQGIALDRGQIRVTKTAGNGLTWRILTNVFEDGKVSVSLGLNP